MKGPRFQSTCSVPLWVIQRNGVLGKKEKLVEQSTRKETDSGSEGGAWEPGGKERMGAGMEHTFKKEVRR